MKANIYIMEICQKTHGRISKDLIQYDFEEDDIPTVKQKVIDTLRPLNSVKEDIQTKTKWTQYQDGPAKVTQGHYINEEKLIKYSVVIQIPEFPKGYITLSERIRQAKEEEK